MSNNAKPDHSLLHRRVEHDFSHYKGTINNVRADIRGYCYFVDWDGMPEQSDWYQLNVLLPLKEKS